MLPAGSLRWSAPRACAASSIMGMSFDISRSLFMSHILPLRCTGMIALVSGVISFSTLRVEMFMVLSSMSASTGLAPRCLIAAIVATNVCAVVITSSPLFIPTASSDSWIASVPLLSPMACFTPMNLARFSSKVSVSFRSMRSPCIRHLSTAGITRCLILS